MKRQHAFGLLACAAILLLIGFAVTIRSVVNRSVMKQSVVKQRSEVQLSQLFQVHVATDSLFVDGATYYSAPLAVPLVYKVPLPEKYDDSDGESFRENRLKNPRRVRLDFTEQIRSYDIRVILHPDEHDDSVGMAEWTFSKDGNMMIISNGFSWRWMAEIDEQSHGGIRYQGETYSINPSQEMVQGKDSVIIDTPFCFKDVDFDGIDEVCFRAPGWNRHYFNVYKILTPANAKLMTGRPFGNIVYSDSGTSTVFNYDDKTIHVVEGLGAVGISDHMYGRRSEVADVLAPMRHICGKDASYGGGLSKEDYFEDGRLVKSIVGYSLDQSDWEIEAEYEAVGEREFSLKTLTCHNWREDGDKYVLYDRD